MMILFQLRQLLGKYPMHSETVFSGAPDPGTGLEVMSSPEGYYVGFRDEDGSPYSRETPYYPGPEEAAHVRLILSRLDHSEVVAMRDTLYVLGILR